MDIVAIHTALVTIWPNGIPPEQYVALAGIFKVCGDLEMAALRERVQEEAVAEGDLAKFMNAIAFTHHPDGREIPDPARPFTPLEIGIALHAGLAEKYRQARPSPQGSASPKPRKGARKGARAFVSVKTMENVKTLLNGGARTKAYIEGTLSLSPRAVRYALAALRERGLVKRIPGKGTEPHTFCLV